MIPQTPEPVKLFTGLLYGPDFILDDISKVLETAFGKIDYKSPQYDFATTDYYAAEMGLPIYRRFVSFAALIDPGELARIKIATNDLEAQMTALDRRKVNLDPGYMDYNKVVLASAKYNGQKIYLGQGIYADPTLWYEKGAFIPYAHSFPDFKLRLYDTAFLHIRALYKKQSPRRKQDVVE